MNKHWSHVARSTAALVLLPVAPYGGGLSAQEPPRASMVDVGGHRLETVVVGHGQPTVVFEAGFIGKIELLRDLQSRIAAVTGTVAYERAGLGESEVGPEPRSATQIAREFRALLDALDIDEPIVLVGHSAGGLFARVFAKEYPDRVAALVLIDPATEDAYDNWRATDPEHWNGFEEEVRAAYDPPPGWYGQWRSLERSIAEARLAWPLPRVPVTVLTACMPFPDEWVLADEARIAEWRQAHEAIVERIPGATHNIVESTDHVGILGHPSVENAILRLIQELRSARGSMSGGG